MKKVQFKSRAQQAGFTLIELIVVIVILGIMAATALPKFADMSTEARVAKMQAAAGSLRTAAATSHALWLAKGKITPIDMDGTSVVIENGYPSAGSIAAAAGLDASDYVIDTATAGQAVVTPDSSHSNCKVTYVAAKVDDPGTAGVDETAPATVTSSLTCD